ncbi:MAG: sulfite exporter TauE/SafE family protein [Clostridia bacterium]
MTAKLIAIGLVTGICNGLFGSGGGTILVPAMVFLLGIEDHKAHATAIMVILPLSILSTIIYYRGSFIDWPTTLRVVSGGMVGSFIGARIFNRIPAYVLRKIFGAFMIIAAIRMVF